MRRKSRISLGHQLMLDILTQLKIDYIPEYSIDILPRRRYDIYFEVNQREYLLEFDGAQHFRRRSLRTLIESQNIDRLKTLAALVSGYTLIRIDYTQINMLRKQIINGINSLNPIYVSNLKKYDYLLWPVKSNLVEAEIKRTRKYKLHRDNLVLDQLRCVMNCQLKFEVD